MDSTTVEGAGGGPLLPDGFRSTYDEGAVARRKLHLERSAEHAAAEERRQLVAAEVARTREAARAARTAPRDERGDDGRPARRVEGGGSRHAERAVEAPALRRSGGSEGDAGLLDELLGEVGAV